MSSSIPFRSTGRQNTQFNIQFLLQHAQCWLFCCCCFFRSFFDSPIEMDRYCMGKHSHGLRIIKINHKDCWALQLNSFSMNEQHCTEKKPPPPPPNCDINYKLKALYMSDIIHIRIIWLCSHLLLFFPFDLFISATSIVLLAHSIRHALALSKFELAKIYSKAKEKKRREQKRNNNTAAFILICTTLPNQSVSFCFLTLKFIACYGWLFIVEKYIRRTVVGLLWSVWSFWSGVRTYVCMKYLAIGDIQLK